jgi:glycosyltransferase involved in cell wall biosynthesis
MAVLEAGVKGVPTVGTAVGHIAEWAPYAAVSVPVGDSTALARMTAELMSDEDRRLRIAREAVRRATQEDADYTARSFQAIYATLTARSDVPAKTTDADARS